MTEILRLPVPPNSIITQTFAEHVAARIVNGWRYYNGGIDWAVTVSTPIKAAADGTVVQASLDKTGYGLHLRIQHTNKDYLSIYAHGSKLLVKVNDRVRAGDIIMLSGNTGNSTGPHLHYELRKKNNAIDPAPFFVGMATPGVPTPEPAPTADWGISLPKFWQARITVPTLNIRREPQVADNNYVGVMLAGMTPEILELKVIGGNTWARIGQNQWIAVNYQGTEHAVPVYPS